MATGTGNLPYAPTYVSPFDVITSQAENETQDNISSLADGSGIGDGAIDTTQLADGAVTTDKLADGAVTTDKMVPPGFIYYTGVGTVTSGNTYTNYTPVETDTTMFTYSSGVWTCVTAGLYDIQTSWNFSTSSAGTTANNEFFLVQLVNPGQSAFDMAASARSSVWRCAFGASRRFAVGEQFSIQVSSSSGLSSTIDVAYSAVTVARRR